MQITRKDGITYNRNKKEKNYDKIITIKINKELKDRLDSLNVNKSQFIRKAIEKELNSVDIILR